MATGNYGIVRPAKVDPEDVQIFYNYTPDRSTLPGVVEQISATSFLQPVLDGEGGNILGGMYNLTLTSDIFSEKGFYNVIIKPREYVLNIEDCGTLVSFPDVKGIVINANDIPANLSVSNELIGYRVEYGGNTFRIITSSDTVEPVNQNLQNSTQKSIRYRYRENTDLIFCTLTPTSAPNTQPNRIPFIGEPGAEIRLSNTFFNPIMLEIEMVDQDIETLAIGLFGNQSKSIVDGTYTLYNFDNEIYRQYRLYEVQDDFNGEPLYEIKENLNTIDDTKDFNVITNI